MTLTQLRYLVAIADAELNITLAATRVHATQPGLSKQLKQLEDELGFLLFVRKGRSLESVTPAGEEVISRSRAVLAEANNIRTYAANQRRESHGQLILTTTHTQARFVLPPAVARIKQAYPQVSVHLQQAAESDALDLLSQGDADIAVISTAGSEPTTGIAVPLYRWRRLVLVPKGHPLDRASTVPDLAALADYPLISYESSKRPSSSLRRAFASRELEPDLALTALDADLIKTYVRAGLGVGLLAEMAVSGNDTDLRAWPAPAAIPECIAWAVLPRDRVLRDYALELVHVLAPQIDKRDLRRVLDGNQEANWPKPPTWESLTQTITS
ncbi:LysR family transcriptional regulator [Stenotrophomonas sp.]|uniref:LysR family transcriptional regulator n=1 Tax=Stenotrophomonas sp. TaxID=69392 RepID=UPI0028AFFA8B|nr:LysR family transcriptional regulator [Stenotrophomonas sp.]